MSAKKPEKKLPQEPQPPIPQEKPARGKKKKEEIALPAPVETVFNLSSMLLVLVTAAVALLSYTAGASFPQILLRTGAAIVVTGTLATFLCTSVNSGALRAAMQEAAQESSTGADGADDLSMLDRRA